MTQKEIIKLSASMIGGYLGCPACFWRDYHYPQEFHLPGVLNRMDKLEKDYYDRHRNQTPPILKGQIKEKLVDLDTAQKLRKGMLFFDEKLNAQFKGKMDDCFIDSKGVFVVMDNKTASPSAEEFLKMYQLQLDSYAFLLKKHGFKVANYGYLVYYVPESGDPDKGIIFKAEAKRMQLSSQRALKTFNAAVKLLRRRSAPKAHKDCEECRWIKTIEGL